MLDLTEFIEPNTTTKKSHAFFISSSIENRASIRITEFDIAKLESYYIKEGKFDSDLFLYLQYSTTL